MDTLGSTNMNIESNGSIQQQLSKLFGTYRAEWLQEEIFDLFTEPEYFPELTTGRSCVLVGGRGTGKTTVLRGLSYEGQHALVRPSDQTTAADCKFIGLYHRVNTNHVTAFQGAGLPESEWIRLFAHYFNLLLCELILDFLAWHEKQAEAAITLSETDCRNICVSLHIPFTATHADIKTQLLTSRIAFEAFVNNVDDDDRPKLSLQQAPVDLLCKAVLSLPAFVGRHFYFLLDEYENLVEYQQRIVNTFVKHTSGMYYFKLGVKELGWACHSTLNPNEQLVHPADYALIKVSDKLQGDAFRVFAKRVCEMRLSRLQLDGSPLTASLDAALPGMSVEQEAVELGVQDAIKGVLKALTLTALPDDLPTLMTMHSHELFFLEGWAKAHSTDPQVLLTEAREDPAKWKERYENHKYAALFAIRKGKRGIDKYYCGWDSFCMLSGGNIRYVLELVDQSFILHLGSGGSVEKPIPPEIQTRAAQLVGSMNLSELEGLSVNGARLTKLLLSLGRVFQQMALEPFGHAPEVNQFALTSTTDDVVALLRAAVMHLALVRYSGTKLTEPADTLAYDYSVHPIYSALFEFSPRRKRKMSISAGQIDLLITEPKKAIDEILRVHRRTGGNPLPQQLTLFTRFFSNDDE